MATIDDVAKAAGVSKGTVSNVFSKKRPISKEVTERVLEVARRLNYKPNYWARTLAIKETRIIGLNMPGEKVKFSHFHMSLLNGVLKVCYERGYRLLVNTLSSEYQNRVEHLVSDPVDGEILLDPSLDDPRIEERVNRGLPMVVIGRPPEGFDSQIAFVDNDNVKSAIEVTEYLIGLGHKRILFLNAPEQRTVAQDRAKGYRMAIDKAGLSGCGSLILFKEESLTSVDFGYETAKRLLSHETSITAVITDTDKMALGVYRAAEELGYIIPQDLSVFAFSDDSVFSPEFSPPLSSVRLNAEELGSEAARLLLDQLASKQQSVQKVVIASEMVLRGSCSNTRLHTSKEA
ncbi:LacI family DNA-binding transcriptional regulator [Effusibacillus lacus]|uniref:LacI family transcriptional regulator n=1 Tax=Effusibacillus lacus TaxID=1348429 RepID=A0A292YLL9_9BACL|nr:LacI family DNA-binding transcriptional regulator [Effusibacillus lacus]TCS69535.1 LacI family transcriptional regulator [Effusibacillus lacus]GAX90056.1 LacI family transcriptional regulator [Effusibacillus lacus]